MTPSQNFNSLAEFCTSGTKVIPDASHFLNGYLENEGYPYEHINYMLNNISKNSLLYQAGLTSIENEINSILTEAEITPNINSNNQLLLSINYLISDSISSASSNYFNKAVSGEINALTELTSVVSTDVILTESSADSYDKRKVTLSSMAEPIGARLPTYKAIEGLIPVWISGDTIDVSPGTAIDGSKILTLPSTLRCICQTSGSWEAGNNKNKLSDGSSSSSSFFKIYLLRKNSDLTIDILYVKSTYWDSFTVPSGYTIGSFIGSFQTDSFGNITRGTWHRPNYKTLAFEFSVPVQELNINSITSGMKTFTTYYIPQGYYNLLHLTVSQASSVANCFTLVKSTSQDDVNPTVNCYNVISTVATNINVANIQVLADKNRQFNYRVNDSVVSYITLFYIQLTKYEQWLFE
jgi:hypothetical protein